MIRMGRYVTGDWEWKFAFGEQGSTFGEILDEICSDLDDVYLRRFIGQHGEGEILELHFDEDTNEFVKACRDYIGEDFKVLKCEDVRSSEYWDKCMIYKFLKDAKFECNETYNFHVEY